MESSTAQDECGVAAALVDDDDGGGGGGDVYCVDMMFNRFIMAPLQ